MKQDGVGSSGDRVEQMAQGICDRDVLEKKDIEKEKADALRTV